MLRHNSVRDLKHIHFIISCGLFIPNTMALRRSGYPSIWQTIFYAYRIRCQTRTHKNGKGQRIRMTLKMRDVKSEVKRQRLNKPRATPYNASKSIRARFRHELRAHLRGPTCGPGVSRSSINAVRAVVWHSSIFSHMALASSMYW